MALSVISAFPIEAKLVPIFLENIINKKVAGLALNILEKLVHRIFSWIYRPYNTLYVQKLSRIHLFSDGKAQLLDSTQHKVAQIKHDQKKNHDYVSLHGENVYFSPLPLVETVFSKASFTEYVAIHDDEKGRPGWYKISQLETPREGNATPMVKSWQVNTNESQRIERSPRPGYLATRDAKYVG